MHVQAFEQLFLWMGHHEHFQAGFGYRPWFLCGLECYVLLCFLCVLVRGALVHLCQLLVCTPSVVPVYLLHETVAVVHAVLIVQAEGLCCFM